MKLIHGRVYRSNVTGNLYKWTKETSTVFPKDEVYMLCLRSHNDDALENGLNVGKYLRIPVTRLEKAPEIYQVFYGS